MRREHSYHHDLQQDGISPRVCGTRFDEGGWYHSEPLAKTSCRLFVCQHFIQPGKQDLVGDLTFIMCVCRARIV
jgi:hypothetical protein